MIDLPNDCGNFFGDFAEFIAIGNISAHQIIGVFIVPALPGRVGVGEVL